MTSSRKTQKRIVALSILVTLGVLTVLMPLWEGSLMPVCQVLLQKVAVTETPKGKLPVKKFKGERLFQHDKSKRTSNTKPKNATPSRNSKWAVIAADIHMPLESVLQSIVISLPSDDWFTALVLESTNTNNMTAGTSYDMLKSKADKHRVHFVSLDYMSRQRGASGSFVEALLQSANHNAAQKNADYLYALQHGAGYLLDLELSQDIADAWKGLEECIFQPTASEHMIVDVPLVGDKRTVNPHAYIFNDTNMGKTWPRGYPDHERAGQLSSIAHQKNVNKDRIGIVHRLSNDPDLDARATLLLRTLDPNHPSQQHPYKQKRRPLLIPSHSVVPYNAKATLHTPLTLWATLLPTTVSAQSADIWRSYIAQMLFSIMGLQVAIVPPSSESNSALNPAGIVKKLEESTVSHTEVSDFLRFLERQQKSVRHNFTESMPQMMEETWIALFEHGFIDENDVRLVQLWLEALRMDCPQYETLTGEPPPLPKMVPYYDNVVLMGQFNYATNSRRFTSGRSWDEMMQLLAATSKGSTLRFDQSRKDLVVEQSLVEQTAFWVQKWREVFEHVQVRGPFSKEHLEELHQVYGITAHGVDSNNGRWKHTYQDKGWYSPIQNLVQTLDEYKDDPDIEGVLYLHDDMLLNISNLVRPSAVDKDDGLQLPFPGTRFPAEKVLTTQGLRPGYMDPRTVEDKDAMSRRSYYIHPNGTFSKLNGESFGTQEALLQSLEPWPWNKRCCVSPLVELAKDPRAVPYLEDNEGPLLIPAWEQSDFLFVPTKFANSFIDIASLFLDHKVFLECAMPTIVDILRQQDTRVKVEAHSLCSTWDGSRGTDRMMSTCPLRKGHPPGMYHPYKLSHGMESWDAMFDSVAFHKD